jgi:hypothetical protein
MTSAAQPPALPAFDHIRVDRRGRILTLAFDCPDRLNAFNARMHANCPQLCAPRSSIRAARWW